MTFISYGVPEKGDAKWLDHQGRFMAAIVSQRGFRLLGAKDVGRPDDYTTEKMPGVSVGLLDRSARGHRVLAHMHAFWWNMCICLVRRAAPASILGA